MTLEEFIPTASLFIINVFITFIGVYSGYLGIKSYHKSNPNTQNNKFFQILMLFKNKISISPIIICVIVSILFGIVTIYINKSNLFKDSASTFAIKNVVNQSKDNSTDSVENLPSITDISHMPMDVYINDRVTFTAKADIDSKKYSVILQFTNTSGEYSSLSDYNRNMDLINGEWTYSQNFNEPQKLHYRILVKDRSNNYKDLKSEEKELIVKKNGSIYDYTKKDIKENSTYIDDATGLSFAVSSIGTYDSSINITYPDNTTDSGYFTVGKTWNFKKDGIKYRVTFLDIDKVNKTYSINIKEIN